MISLCIFDILAARIALEKIFEFVKPFWYEGYPHDALLWRYAIITESLYYIPVRTIYWRRHTGAATARKVKTVDEK